MLTATLGASDAWDAMLYGESNQSTLAYMQNRFENAKSMFSDAAMGFYHRAEEAFNMFNGAEAINFARRTLAKVNNFFDAPRIMEYRELAHFQQANTVMQRWIMAEPGIRQMYHQQMCDGYADTYVDIHPGKVGVDHYDWRRVNNTMVQFQEDGGYVAQQFADELLDNDRELVFSERVAILNTWEALRAYTDASGDDPTSPVGGKF